MMLIQLKVLTFQPKSQTTLSIMADATSPSNECESAQEEEAETKSQY
jgi:hypothetical protein